MLGLARSTVARKIAQRGALSQSESEKLVGIERLIGQVDATVREAGEAPHDFDAVRWPAWRPWCTWAAAWRCLVRIDAPAVCWTARTVFDAARHVGWDALPAGRVSISWGTAWAASGASLMAQVPSVIVPEEHNLLINPLHPDAAQLCVTRLRRWLYDPRAVAGPT